MVLGFIPKGKKLPLYGREKTEGFFPKRLFVIDEKAASFFQPYPVETK